MVPSTVLAYILVYYIGVRLSINLARNYAKYRAEIVLLEKHTERVCREPPNESSNKKEQTNADTNTNTLIVWL